MARNYSIFVSHSWDHVGDLRNLRDLLENCGYINVNFEKVQNCFYKFDGSAFIKPAINTKTPSNKTGYFQLSI